MKRLFLAGAVGVAVAATAGTASADHSSYSDPYRLGYTTCSWAGDAGSVTVSVDPSLPFAPSSTAPDNGARQSFDDRINGAVASWNNQLSTARWGETMVRSSEGDYADIVLSSVDPSAGDFLGYTYVRRSGDAATSSSFGGRCPHETNPDLRLTQVRIEMAVEDNWFTQGDAYRAAWEDCGRSGGPNWPYTCGKLYDFEALMAHEFGHAHGLMHPTLIDSTASSLANCGSVTSRATICAATKSSLTHRSEQRTLDAYDRNSVHYHYSVKG